jgi:ATP-dependent exoDNAse (exonuclease V) beta subunit
LELGLESGDSDLLLAPISAEGMNKNLIEAYLQQTDKTKGHFENGRLLYVAATRAKRDLHLLGHTSLKENEDGFTLHTPSKNSLLESLWPVLEKDFQSALAGYEVDTSDHEEPTGSFSGRIRLAKEWSLPSTLKSIQVDHQLAENLADDFVEFDWAGETARHVGNVVHRLLQYLGDTGIDQVKPEDRQRLKQVGQKMLERIGVPKAHFDDAVAKVGDAIESTVDDTRGQWILSGRHENARCELALSGHQDGKVKHMVIDRTFVDEQGTRWIIDYKTGTHAGGGADAFLDREQERYRHQLESYASALSKIEEKPIRMALYYPLLKGWREWPFQKEG